MVSIGRGARRAVSRFRGWRWRVGVSLFVLATGLSLAPRSVAPTTPLATGQRPGRRSRIGGGFAVGDADWRFVMASRPVKVVVLAGSIGAFPGNPYARHLHSWCSNAEFRNLSMVGFGAYQLYDRLVTRVLRQSEERGLIGDVDAWLMWNGGLNSAGLPELTNRYIRRAFMDAHRAGIKVVGLTLTPWGSLDDRRRWGGARALTTYRNTRDIVDFVMGRLSPERALGRYLDEREAGRTPWLAEERADIAVDLFDSALRDRDAALRPIREMRGILRANGHYRSALAPLPPTLRPARLVADSVVLAALPRWFLRPEYRAFDPIHPNREGHLAIAKQICPRLPAEWGCACPSAPLP